GGVTMTGMSQSVPRRTGARFGSSAIFQPLVMASANASLVTEAGSSVMSVGALGSVTVRMIVAAVTDSGVDIVTADELNDHVPGRNVRKRSPPPRKPVSQ